MKKRSLLISSLLVFTLALAGCSAKKTEEAQKQPSSTASTQTQDNSLSKVKSEGKILIGTEGTYAPFTFHDSTGKLTGFDVEIAEEVAKRLGVKAEFVETKWDGMFAGLDSKRFDAIANQVGIKAERKEKYDFSDPYITSKAVLVVAADSTSITKFDDLKGKKSAQSLTSNYAEIAKSFGAELVQIDGFNQAIDLITSKRADATVNDSLSFLDLKKQKPDLAIKVAAEHTNASQSGIMFRKGSTELVTAVNKALADMKADGTYLKISNKWFGADVSK
jgi:cystine transport system substrate-binding protein